MKLLVSSCVSFEGESFERVWERVCVCVCVGEAGELGCVSSSRLLAFFYSFGFKKRLGNLETYVIGAWPNNGFHVM